MIALRRDPGWAAIAVLAVGILLFFLVWPLVDDVRQEPRRRQRRLRPRRVCALLRHAELPRGPLQHADPRQRGDADLGRRRRRARAARRALRLPAEGAGHRAAAGHAGHPRRRRRRGVDVDPRPAGHRQRLARAARDRAAVDLLVVGPRVRDDAQQLRLRVRGHARRVEGRRPQPRGGGPEPRPAAGARVHRRDVSADPAVDLRRGAGRVHARHRQLRRAGDPRREDSRARGQGLQRVRQRDGRQPADADDDVVAAGVPRRRDAAPAEAPRRAPAVPDGGEPRAAAGARARHRGGGRRRDGRRDRRAVDRAGDRRAGDLGDAGQGSGAALRRLHARPPRVGGPGRRPSRCTTRCSSRRSRRRPASCSRSPART